MENTLFRKQSVDHISSPEDLHNYLRVTSPKMWMLLVAIMALLIGFIRYSAAATMENVLPVKVEAETYENDPEFMEEGAAPYTTYIHGCLPIQMMETLQVGMKVRIAGEEGHIYYISTVYDDEDGSPLDELYYYVELDDGAYLPGLNGECDAEIVLESTTPINLLWGGE